MCPSHVHVDKYRPKSDGTQQHIGRHRPNFGRLQAELGRHRANPNRDRPQTDRLRVDLSSSGTYLLAIAPSWSTSEKNMPIPTHTAARTRPNLGRSRPAVGQMPRESGPMRARILESVPEEWLPQRRATERRDPHRFPRRLLSSSAEFDPASAKFGTDSTREIWRETWSATSDATRLAPRNKVCA